jgi:cell cycle checkpoint protein
VTSIGAGSRSKRRWAGEGDPAAGGGPGGDEEEDWRAGGGGGGGAGSKRGRTGMRMSWKGPGHELEVLLWVVCLYVVLDLSCLTCRKDDNRGPTTRCSLKTMEPEELMNQAFDESQT